MQNTTPATRDIYRERLTPSLWLFVAGALVGPMAAIVFVPMGALVAVGVGIGIVLAVILTAVFSSATVRVAGGRLFAGRAQIDVRFLGEPESFTADAARHARGAGIDTRGWYLIRGGVDGVVVVPNVDPADPISSWTISSRTPDRLAAAIRTAQTEGARGDAHADVPRP